MRVLITGAHGFVGSHLCEAFVAAGHTVRALVSPWGKTDNLEGVEGRLELVRTDIRTDIRAPDGLSQACQDIEVVVHAAARVADYGPWQPFYETNVLGTKHLLEAAVKASVRRFVFVSSLTVHKYTGHRHADPRTALRDGADTNAYARSKVMAENLVLHQGGLERVIIRPGLFLFGPRDPHFLRYARALRRRTLPLVGNGATILNTAYAENLALGVLRAAEAEEPKQVYLIADDGAPSWREVFGYLAHLLGVPAPWLHVPPPLALALGSSAETLGRLVAPQRDPTLTRYRASLMTRDTHFCDQAARDDLGYRPLLSWQEGMKRTLEAHKIPTHEA